MKTNADYFRDWEGEVFGYGYGSGEPHIVDAMKAFFGLLKDGRCYDYRELELAIQPIGAWLLINALCRADIIEYGSSPRFGWITKHGEALRDFMAEKSADELLCILDNDNDYIQCYRDHCNCEQQMCNNPFWRTLDSRTHSP